MAKISKRQLKTIVKECLVEILTEGLSSSITSGRSSSEEKKKKIQMEERRLAVQRKKFDSRMVDTVSAVTDDTVMQEILSQTAATTLQEQIEHDKSHAPNLASPEGSGGAGINLDNIFSDSRPNWSSLAFKEKKSD